MTETEKKFEFEIMTNLLSRVVDNFVEKVFGNFSQEFSRLTRGMSAEHRKMAAMIILDMLEESVKTFITKMRERVSRDGWGGGGH